MVPSSDSSPSAKNTRCLFCGGRLSSDATASAEACSRCGNDAPTSNERARELHVTCPRCFVALEIESISSEGAGTELGAFLYCIGCHGCLVPAADWSAILDRADANTDVTKGSKPLPPDQGLVRGALERSVGCPVCHVDMIRAQFPTKPGLVVDTCKQHGIWFDASELAVALRGIDSGESMAKANVEAPRDAEVRGVVASILSFVRGVVSDP